MQAFPPVLPRLQKWRPILLPSTITGCSYSVDTNFILTLEYNFQKPLHSPDQDSRRVSCCVWYPIQTSEPDPQDPLQGSPPLFCWLPTLPSVQSTNCVSFLARLKMLTLNSDSSRVLSHHLESPASSSVLAVGFTCSAELPSQSPPSPEFHSGHPSIPSTTHSTIWLLSAFVVFSDSLSLCSPQTRLLTLW